jgi:hypothetical protein
MNIGDHGDEIAEAALSTAALLIHGRDGSHVWAASGCA